MWHGYKHKYVLQCSRACQKVLYLWVVGGQPWESSSWCHICHHRFVDYVGYQVVINSSTKQCMVQHSLRSVAYSSTPYIILVPCFRLSFACSPCMWILDMLLVRSSRSMLLQISLLGSWSSSTCRFMATEGVELTNFWCNFATNWSDLMLRGCDNASSRETWWTYLVLDGCHSGGWTNETIRMWIRVIFGKKKIRENDCLLRALKIMNLCNWLLQILPLLHWSSCTIGGKTWLHVPPWSRWPNRRIHFHFLMSYHVYITLSTTFSCMNISVQTQRDLQKLADILASSSFCGGVWGHGWGSTSTMQGSFLWA